MGGLLLGFALGAMAFTAHGRELGNKIGNAVIERAKEVISDAKKPTEQPSGTVGNSGDSG